MPLHYGSQVEEHHAVRRNAGVFDVSHMRVVDLDGAESAALLSYLLTGNIDRREVGQAMYACMLNEAGGVVDDLIVYRVKVAPVEYRLILNAATADRDIGWLKKVAAEIGATVDLASRGDLAILALQGPQAAEVLAAAVPSSAKSLANLGNFRCMQFGRIFIGRTGYTGEDGFELVLPSAEVATLWKQLIECGARACGLGARDTLRLEAGMCLYGQDLEESVSPLESSLDWAVDLNDNRSFIGRGALEAQRAAGGLRKLLGLVLEGRGVLRSHQEVRTDAGMGMTTSGTFSPTLQVSIGLARLPAGVKVGDRVEVELRGGVGTATVVRPRFVRNGKALIARPAAMGIVK